MIDQVRLGASGLHVSRLALGMMSFGAPRAWVLDEDRAAPIVKRALEAGITFFDTADMYEDGASEIVTGRLLRKLASREEVVVATKVFYPTTSGPNGRGLSRKHILAAADASLERLGLDYVDLYQIHRFDAETPIEETVDALHDVVRAGKARYVGACTMAAWQFAKAQHAAERHGWTRFSAMQSRCNLLCREDEREMIPLCVDQGVGVIAYSPLARGLLAGTRSADGRPLTTRAHTDPIHTEAYGTSSRNAVVRRVTDVAQRRGVSPAQVALAWTLHRPGVSSALIGATKPSHVDDAEAAAALTLTAEEIALLEERYVPYWGAGAASDDRSGVAAATRAAEE